VTDTLAPELAKEQEIDPGVMHFGGRHFVVTPETTQRQDFFVMSILEKAGLEKLQGQAGETGDLSELAIKILSAAYANDTVFDLVAAILTETDAQGAPLPIVDEHGKAQPWTKAKTLEISDFIANLRGKEEKNRLNGLMTSVLVLFFSAGAASQASFLSSSPAPKTSSRATPRRASSSRGTASPSIDVASLPVDPKILETGTTPSAPSAGSTPTGSSESATGT
jgi:hypothetical protein